MVQAGLKETNPKEEAKKIADAILRAAPAVFFEKVETAGPGFINLYVSKETMAKEVAEILKKEK
jgi:arginyl-tRNA synthetase